MTPATGIAPNVGRVKFRCACTAFSVLSSSTIIHAFRRAPRHRVRIAFFMPAGAQHESLEVCAIQDGARCHTLPAQIPGTVLSNLIAANLFPDPNIGVSHGSIPDIYHIGRDFYTYSFFTEFRKPHDWDAAAGCRALLTLHGINYSAWYAEAPLLHLHSLCLQTAM